MKYDSAFDVPRARREQIRQLGYDPEQLTAGEQRELLELEAALRAEAPAPTRDLVTR